MIALWLMLTACGVPVADPAPGGDEVFPHPEGFAAGVGHGAAAMRVGSAACVSCHAEGSEGPPSCTSCHTGWPHGDTWLSGAVHGAGLTGPGGAVSRQACATCHAVADTVARANASCDSCHTSYPHAAGWLGAHGGRARASAGAACASCHGAELGGGANAPSCASCHLGWPHPAGWSSAHGASARSDAAACAGCHGADGGGGSAEVSCSRCHTAWPHPADWQRSHIDAADAGERACLTCHQAGDGPATMPATCASACHGGTP